MLGHEPPRDAARQNGQGPEGEMSLADVARLKTGWSGELASQNEVLMAKRLHHLGMP